MERIRSALLDRSIEPWSVEIREISHGPLRTDEPLYHSRTIALVRNMAHLEIKILNNTNHITRIISEINSERFD